MNRFRLCLLLISLTLLSANLQISVGAQDDDPLPGPQASALLLDPTEIGADWVASDVVGAQSVDTWGFEMSPDVFREGAARVYGGPQGSRIILISLLLSESGVAIRRSWEDASAFIDGVRISISYDYDRRDALETLEPPPGCLEAKREEGIEELYLMPVGATMCATDPDAILIAIVSGTVNNATGVAASDALVEAMANKATTS